MTETEPIQRLVKAHAEEAGPQVHPEEHDSGWSCAQRQRSLDSILISNQRS